MRLFLTAVKWTCTLLSALILFCWVLSGWFDLSIYTIDTSSSPPITIESDPSGPCRYGIWINSGRVVTPAGKPPTQMRGFHADMYRCDFEWNGWAIHNRSSPMALLFRDEWSIPLWLFATPFVVASSILWGRDAVAHRRNRRGHCAACGYDCTKIRPGHPCPECGFVLTPGGSDRRPDSEVRT
jgi:hypothetical protein